MVTLPLLLRAAALVTARTPNQFARLRRGESRVIQSTNTWYRQRGVVGAAVGYKFTGGQRLKEFAVQIFVRKKAAGIDRARAVRSFQLQGEPIPVDVLASPTGGVATLQVKVSAGDPVAPDPRDNQGRESRVSPGTLAGVLRGPDGVLYGLSAAHVLGQAIDRSLTGRRASDRRRLRPGDPIMRLGAGGVTVGMRTAGHLADRAILDFSNDFRGQNLDAAIFSLDTDDAPDAADVPYGPPSTAVLGDRVFPLGIVNSGPSHAGDVVSIHYRNEDDRFKYADAVGKLRPIRFQGLLLAEYESSPGDSGAMIVREADRAPVGLHMGRIDVDGRSVGLFVDLQRVLGRWPHLSLITETDGSIERTG